ncbi:hypothetical protein RchiOBHm_Chr3g0486911 [Rosa chinensis]|uniref:Uncharacterized protein n=1 Tax=Rosa chinensis TaxID=74649 RepID=A0A2P6RFC8_ROSCH|nr:hypothetical protein RchiOBHm_Chr3g0486911 [Rosa chinensis]
MGYSSSTPTGLRPTSNPKISQAKCQIGAKKVSGVVMLLPMGLLVHAFDSSLLFSNDNLLISPISHSNLRFAGNSHFLYFSIFRSLCYYYLILECLYRSSIQFQGKAS